MGNMRNKKREKYDKGWEKGAYKRKWLRELHIREVI